MLSENTRNILEFIDERVETVYDLLVEKGVQYENDAMTCPRALIDGPSVKRL